eukprot:TRINITY_DN67_c1_g1_i3.p1 TRINITY_DN67_c1_g1~~TRINITY_DN67_c1_g1_i3.p1  ORF type:complete len:125 (-),score=58.91 TRINITY_DN67_c1_g1_i3:98-472(-)
MSWQTYVDNLVGHGFAKGVLLGHNGAVWAASAGLTLSGPEVAALTGGFNSPNSVLQSGVTLAGTKYFVIKADNRSIYGKQGNTGFCAVKTGQAVVLGFYSETLTPGNASKAAEGVADYLINLSY